MEEEFEGGKFGEDGEYYFKTKKKGSEDGRKRPTKEQQIYGDFINVSQNLSLKSFMKTKNDWDSRDFG